ncbi:MAG: hypothetical protein Q4C86_10820 [bacterium]|nr:hypothetical protein [bacterium]
MPIGKRKKKSAAASNAGPAKAKQGGRSASLRSCCRCATTCVPVSCPKLLLDGTPRCGFVCRDFGALKTHEDGGPVKSGRCMEA